MKVAGVLYRSPAGREASVDIAVSLVQCACLLALSIGMVITFRNWASCSGHFWGDVDPILVAEIAAINERLNCTADLRCGDVGGPATQKLHAERGAEAQLRA